MSPAATEMRRNVCEAVIRQLPVWPRTAPRDEVIAAMHPRLQQARDRFALGDRSLVITGPSGAGKTIWAADAVLRLTERLDIRLSELRGIVWTTGHALAKARRETALGKGEAPLVSKCIEARILIIDELGYEPLTEVPFEVVDARYAAGRTTVVTSGLTPAAFQAPARYGAAMWRRLTQQGELDSAKRIVTRAFEDSWHRNNKCQTLLAFTRPPRPPSTAAASDVATVPFWRRATPLTSGRSSATGSCTSSGRAGSMCTGLLPGVVLVRQAISSPSGRRFAQKLRVGALEPPHGMNRTEARVSDEQGGVECHRVTGLLCFVRSYSAT